VSGPSLPLADAGSLRPLGRRTAAERALAAAALVALVLAAAAAGRKPDVRRSELVPAGSDGIVVLDLSASISSDTYARIGATLADLADSGGRFGLVVFSDVAYEALPPGTPARELRPFVHYFTLPKKTQPGFLPEFPKNPWTDTFSGGTRISTGLEAAREVALRERLRRPALLLISDLDDDPVDLPRLRQLLTEFEREGLRLQIVSLNASPEDERFFARVLGGPKHLRPARLPGEQVEQPDRATLPLALAAAALAAVLLLAANELRFARLTWEGAP
jgi:hypothetical protein